MSSWRMPVSKRGWTVIRCLSGLGNLLYIVAALSAVVVLATLGSTPWRSYANVLVFVAVPIVAVVVNLRMLRRAPRQGTCLLAIVLNVLCFGYLAAWPEYAHVALKGAVLLVPLLNVLVAARSLARTRSPSRVPATGH